MVTKWIVLIIFVFIFVFFLVRAIGKAIYNRTPNGGINESMYIDVNGVKQWINIFGEDKNNPVLLYLHGGPGSSTSYKDYSFTRKWADVYTIVTWDQRNCGKSYSVEQNDIVLTRELFMTDGKEVAKFICEYLTKDKITILGHSWGSIFGANLVLEYPDYYECFIGTGQLIDSFENEIAFKEEALEWAKDDAEALQLINKLTPNQITREHISTRNALMKKYGYDMLVNGTDYNIVATTIFNPNYSIIDWLKYSKVDNSVYLDFIMSSEFTSFSLKDVTIQPFINFMSKRVD